MRQPSATFTCPGCQTPLELERGEPAGETACPACCKTYPKLGTLPVLLPNAAEVLQTWRARLAAFVDETRAVERHLWAELVEPGLLDGTRRRLRQVAEAMPNHRALVLDLFREAGLSPEPAPSVEDPGSLLDFVTLVFRDYAWAPEVDEVAPALAKLRAVLPEAFRLGRTLVLGAGTARLAWDLSHLIDPTAELYAIDQNPLPFLVTERLLRGREVSLYELPGHPRHAEAAAVRRTLSAPHPAPASLRLLLADGLNIPVPPASFDTVVTPWFIDQVPRDLGQFLPELSRVLRPGGAWLHTGPFVYDPARTKPAHRYGKDELFELADKAGFQVTAAEYAPAQYLCSPLSTQGRVEWVLTFHAVRAGNSMESAEPTWLAAGAIPRFEFQAEKTWPLPMLERVLELVDGERGVQDIALALLARGELADDGNAEAVVRGCLRVLWRAARDGAVT